MSHLIGCCSFFLLFIETKYATEELYTIDDYPESIVFKIFKTISILISTTTEKNYFSKFIQEQHVVYFRSIR